MKPPSPIMDNEDSDLQDMSSSFNESLSSIPTPSSAMPNVAPVMISSTVSDSTCITQSTSMTQPQSLSKDSQQSIVVPATTVAATGFSALASILKAAKTYIFENFKHSCEITASPDSDDYDEWDFLEEINFLIPQPSEIALKTGTDGEESSDADDVEWEDLEEFNPLISLPSEIAWETGKYEEVLFEDQAKLYKFVDQKWKEHNLCIIKILLHSLKQRVRLVMRKEEVLKTCANHYITHDMELHPLEDSDQAWTWIAQEWVNGELKPEHFCIQFEDAELSAAFEAAFIKAVNIAKGTPASNSNIPEFESTESCNVSKLFGLKSALTELSLRDPVFEYTNVTAKFFCIICKTTRHACCRDCRVNIGAEKCVCSREHDMDSRTDSLCSSKAPTTENHNHIARAYRFADRENSWCCPLCETLNKADRSMCIICERMKPNTFRCSEETYSCSECETYSKLYGLSDDTLSSDEELCKN